MFSIVRIPVSSKVNSVFLAHMLCQPRIIPPKQLFSSSKKARYIFKDYVFLRFSNTHNRYELKTDRRYISDNLSKKGRGEELNYALKLSREQFLKLKERKIKEIEEDIKALEARVRKMDKKTSRKADVERQNLMAEIRGLRAMLERYKKGQPEKK